MSTGAPRTVGNAEIFRSLSEIWAVEFPVFYEQLWLEVVHVLCPMYYDRCIPGRIKCRQLPRRVKERALIFGKLHGVSYNIEKCNKSTVFAIRLTLIIINWHIAKRQEAQMFI